MLDFAMKVSQQAQAVDDADNAALREHGFSDDEIWDVAAIAAFFGMSNRLANFTSLRPNDEFYILGRVRDFPVQGAGVSRRASGCSGRGSRYRLPRMAGAISDFGPPADDGLLENLTACPLGPIERVDCRYP